MITKESLEANGYRFCAQHHQGEWCTGLWQKWVTMVPSPEREVRLYAINVYLWKFPEKIRNAIGERQRFSVEVRFYLPEDREVQFEPLCPAGETVESLEAFLLSSYQSLRCVPDRDNQR